MYDVTVVGAGLAGLQLARLLAARGHSVLLVDARRTIGTSVRTTGIFVRRSIEDFPVIHPFLGDSIRNAALHSPAGRRIELPIADDEFRVGRMQPLYETLLEQAIRRGVTWRPATVFAGLSPQADHLEIHFRDGSTERSRFIAGADGVRSKVAAALHLDRNRHCITGVERVYRSVSRRPPRFDILVDPVVSPGYVAWLVDDGEEVHAGVGGDPSRFNPTVALTEVEKRFRSSGVLTSTTLLEERGGLIPVGGVLRRIATSRGLLAGDAAGAVSPLTAGGLDACLRLSAHAASVLDRAIAQNCAITGYEGAPFRSRFSSRIAMRSAFDLLSRSHRLIELGFAVAGLPGVDAFIRHVLCGRGSFPDTESPAAHDVPAAPHQRR